jgi:hypothetical protein
VRHLYSTRHICRHFSHAEANCCTNTACEQKDITFRERISEDVCPKCQEERKAAGLDPDPTFWAKVGELAGDNAVGLLCVIGLVGDVSWLGRDDSEGWEEFR